MIVGGAAMYTKVEGRRFGNTDGSPAGVRGGTTVGRRAYSSWAEKARVRAARRGALRF